MKNYFDVKGKNAIVTGASSGLGRQFALCLAEQGANVAIAARRVERLEEVKKQIEAYGVKCVVCPCDVTDSSQIKAAVDKTIAEFGSIDILINNAAAGFSTPALECDDETWERTMKTNVDGVFYFCREVGRHMVERGYGKIVNIGSFHCMVTMNGVPRSGYSTAKGAVLMMSKALAAEWAKSGVTVNVLGPGYFESEMAAKVTNAAYDEGIKRGCPMGRRGKPGELNGAMLFLASDASSYVTGQLLLVDGGWTIV
ncbi:MAG: SDR family NAD(P)-dependent oxidoreductase [Tractidigestivibacter sp.]|jgi:NAD(P)-dependent dehydrogenase (short-subunit alcohol dehydrogenase family)|uniref:SDR family NAD(P)-dependent oxidoreductase n=1 Tax=Tractidigestivibacter sp. TaxID=2847320 RepID=UPI003D939710